MKALHALAVMALGSACTYEPPTRSSAWYENPHGYADESDTHPGRAEFQEYLDRAVRDGLPGAALLIRTPEHGTWAGAAGYADIASGVPWQPSMRARVGSVTKTFAAATILRLVERERLALDEPVRDLLPSGVVSGLDNADRVTLRELLQHTSGLFDYLKSSELFLEAAGSYDYEYQSREALLAYAYDHAAEFEPGTSWSYSNTNFLLLEPIAEAASGRSGKRLLEQTVFEPLALVSTSYDPRSPAPDGMVRGYADLFADGELIDVTDSNLERFHYDGGVISNVYDLADFLDALLLGSLLGDTAREQMLDVVSTEGRSERGTDYYGLGLILERHPEFGPVYGHSGTAFGFSAHVYHLADYGITYAAIVNASQHTLEERSYRWFSPLKHDDVLRLVTSR